MSRRSRRRNGTTKSFWLGRVLIGSGVMLLVVLGIGYAGLRSYLHSDGFRKFLSSQVSGAAKVRGEFESFQWDGLAVKTDGFKAVGDGSIASIVAERVETEIGFGGFTRGFWEMKQSRIGRLDLEISGEKVDEPEPLAPEIREKAVAKKQPRWVPREVELDSLEIGRLTVRVATGNGEAKAEGMAARILPTGGENSYSVQIEGGSLMLPSELVPELEVERIDGVYNRKSFFLNELSLRGWDHGRVQASGEFDLVADKAALEGSLDGLRCDELFNENWARRVTGEVSSTFVFDNRGGTEKVSGLLGIENGTLTALPMLDALAAYADTRRFRVMQLSEARTNWEYSKDGILFDHLVMASEGLIRLEGRFSVKGERVEGDFMLGLVPGVLSNIPGAETAVFKRGSHGLLWAPVRITGTLDDLDEDLTERLIEAAGMRMIEKLPESGAFALKYAETVIEKNSGKAVKEGVKAIEKADKILEEAGNILDGILR